MRCGTRPARFTGAGYLEPGSGCNSRQSRTRRQFTAVMVGGATGCGRGQRTSPWRDRAVSAVRSGKSSTKPTNRWLSIRRPFADVRRRKQRGPVSSPRHDNPGTAPIDIAVVPPRRVSGRTKRASCQMPRKRMLSSEQGAAIGQRFANMRQPRASAPWLPPLVSATRPFGRSSAMVWPRSREY